MDKRSNDAVQDQLISYLDLAGQLGHDYLIASAPLNQSVEVPSAWWREHLSEVRLPHEVRTGVDCVLDRVEASNDVVDRRMLTTLSAEAGTGEAARVSLWFATMCWGAGPRNNYRVRQWQAALTWEHLMATLADTHRAVRAGRLVDAHKGARMPHTGEAFFTKWLWAVGLSGLDGDTRPYVLDDRVNRSLARLEWSPLGRNASVRWLDYCIALDRWAAGIATLRPAWTIDGGRLEHLLFDREMSSFYSWSGAGV